jgi:hypothetical protein
MPATGAGIAMTAQSSGAAAPNGPKRFELLEVKAGSIPIQEAIAQQAEVLTKKNRSAATRLWVCTLIRDSLSRPLLSIHTSIQLKLV